MKQNDILRNNELELAAVPWSSEDTAIRRLGTIKEFRCKDSGINYQRVNVGMRVKGKSDLAARLLYEGARQRDVDQMFWKGSDISKYWIEPTTDRYCRPDVRLRSNEVVHLGTKVYNTVPKILIRQTSDIPIAALDEQGVWFGRSIIAIIKVSGDYALEYLLGILNSSFIREAYEKLVHEKGRVFAQVKLSKLNQLPIRALDFSNPIDKQHHDQMVQLVRQVIHLIKRRKASRSEHERTALTRQIDLTQTQIDDLVVKLYEPI